MHLYRQYVARSRWAAASLVAGVLAAQIGCKPGTEPSAPTPASARELARVERLERAVVALKAELDALKNSPPCGKDLVKIYGATEGDGPIVARPYVDCTVRLPAKASLLQKVKLVASRLSVCQFGGKPIQVLRIERRKGKQVAVVNMPQQGPLSGGWHQSFQGSTGGAVAETRLVQTMLQRDYDGPWIDGVQFLYDNEPAELSHVSLGAPVFRDYSEEVQAP